MFSVYVNNQKSVLFAIILIINCLIITAQNDGESCTLPDGRKSTCTRIHYCQSIFDPIKLIRGPLPSNLDKILKDHQCTRNNVVCCPDGVPKVIVEPTSATNDISSKIHPRADIDKIETHRNINLINADNCGLKSTNRIVGGKTASLGEFPWNALLRYSSNGDLSFNCGGTLISKRYVLTAAHCIIRSMELVSVRLGEHKISNTTDCESNEDEEICADPVQDIPVETVVKHASYSNLNKINDIAIIRLRREAVLNSYVKTICLPTQRRLLISNVDTSSTMAISGWGLVETGKDMSDILIKAIVPYITNSVCEDRFKSVNIPVYSSYLCAGGNNKTDTCSGDSGGGITAFTSFKSKPRMLLYGVVSGGVDCQNALKIFPGVYTDTAHYLDWILDNMKP